jgi:hypothetical protein
MYLILSLYMWNCAEEATARVYFHAGYQYRGWVT